MRILEIEEFFQNEDTLDKVIEYIKEDVENIDYWSGVRKNNLTDNPEEITKALNELSGDYSNLRVVLGIAETELGNREVRKYNSVKMQLEKDGKKLTTQVDSAIKKEASACVGSYRRIYNIIKSYTEACAHHTITLQSILKKWEKDYKNPQ